MILAFHFKLFETYLFKISEKYKDVNQGILYKNEETMSL